MKMITRPRFPVAATPTHCWPLTVYTKTAPQRCQGTLKTTTTAQISDQLIQTTRTGWEVPASLQAGT